MEKKYKRIKSYKYYTYSDDKNVPQYGSAKELREFDKNIKISSLLPHRESTLHRTDLFKYWTTEDLIRHRQYLRLIHGKRIKAYLGTKRELQKVLAERGLKTNRECDMLEKEIGGVFNGSI